MLRYGGNPVLEIYKDASEDVDFLRLGGGTGTSTTTELKNRSKF